MGMKREVDINREGEREQKKDGNKKENKYKQGNEKD